MTAADIIARIEAVGGSLTPKGDRISYRLPPEEAPALVAELREHKAEVLALLHQRQPATTDIPAVAESDAGYHARVEAVLNAVCVPSYPPGMIHWLEKGDPNLYDDLTRCLPNLIHALWTAHAPLDELQPVVDSWLTAYRRAYSLFKGARRVFSGGLVLSFDLNGTVPEMPEGVRLLEWNPKTPPVAISYCTVVTDVERFIAATLAELRAAMKGQRWMAGNRSVRELIDRLEQVGVRVEIKSNDGAVN